MFVFGSLEFLLFCFCEYHRKLCRTLARSYYTVLIFLVYAIPHVYLLYYCFHSYNPESTNFTFKLAKILLYYSNNSPQIHARTMYRSHNDVETSSPDHITTSNRPGTVNKT